MFCQPPMVRRKKRAPFRQEFVNSLALLITIENEIRHHAFVAVGTELQGQARAD